MSGPFRSGAFNEIKRNTAVDETLLGLLRHILFSVYIGMPVCICQILFLCGPNFTRWRQQVRQTLSTRDQMAE